MIGLVVRLLAVAVVLVTGADLSGCSYDYLQHSDRVAYSDGDAVKANLEAETIDPSKRSMYSKRGLGKNGALIPAAAPTTTPATGASTTPGG